MTYQPHPATVWKVLVAISLASIPSASTTNGVLYSAGLTPGRNKSPLSIIIDTIPMTSYTITMQSPIVPGEILLEDYLKPMGISQNAMARAIGVSQRAINEIVHGKRSITPAMSIRFGAFFGQSEQFWHGTQVECDFRRLAADKQSLTAGITPAASLTRAP